jgi:hypothetical protein
MQHGSCSALHCWNNTVEPSGAAMGMADIAAISLQTLAQAVLHRQRQEATLLGQQQNMICAASLAIQAQRQPLPQPLWVPQ